MLDERPARARSLADLPAAERPEAGLGIAALTDPANLLRGQLQLVAVERPDGLLVARLLDARLRVLALHPVQAAAARDRFRVSGRCVRPVRRVRAVTSSRGPDRTGSGCPGPTRTHEGSALPDPMSRGSRPDAHGARQPVAAELERFWPGPPGLLPVSFRGRGLARVPRALPQPGGHARARRGAPRRVPDTRGLLGPPNAGAAALDAASRARRPGRGAGAPGPPAAGADAGVDDQARQRAGQGARGELRTSGVPGAASYGAAGQGTSAPYDPTRHGALERHLTVAIPTPSGPVVDQAATDRTLAHALADQPR
jgi:hypothetical protein